MCLYDNEQQDWPEPKACAEWKTKSELKCGMF